MPASLRLVGRAAYRAWMAFGKVMTWIFSRLVLLLLFCLVMVPIALLARLTGKKFLEVEGRSGSYWVSSKNRVTSDCTRQY